MGNIIDYSSVNEKKILELRKKIFRCIQNNEPFTLRIFDIDDTLNDSTPTTEDIINELTDGAYYRYQRHIEYARHDPIDFEEEEKKYRNCLNDLRNMVLEEYGKYEGAVDYERIHSHLYPGSIEAVNYLISNRSKNEFVILCSQVNPLREEQFKIQRYHEHTNGNLDGIICLPVFRVPYQPGIKRNLESKVNHIMSKLGIPYEYLSNCRVYDDSPRVRRDFKEQGGIVIPVYMRYGYIEELQDDPQDRERVIVSWDNRIISQIDTKIAGDWKIYDKTKNFQKIKTR